MKKRILSLLLAVLLCAALLPIAAQAAAEQPGMLSYPRYYKDSTKGVQPYKTSNEYHYIYFGEWGGQPIKWRVLDVQEENRTSSKLLLLADECLSDSPMAFSAVQSWCTDFYKKAFTDLECSLIRSSTDGAYIFVPSAQEVSSAIYGFAGNPARIAVSASGGTSASYWLRSDSTEGSTNVPGYVNETGDIESDTNGNGKAGIRPALYLDSSNNNFRNVSAAEGVKSAEGTTGGVAAVQPLEVTEWKLTTSGDLYSEFRVVAYDVGDSFYLAYTNAEVGTNEYISAYFSILENGNTVITHYGRLGKVTGSSGTIKVAKASLPLDKSFWIYNEQYNGDKHTDYSSGLALLNLSNTNICVPSVEVTTSLTGITSNATPYAAKNTDYRAKLSVTDSDKYMLPKTITVTIDGAELPVGEYSYNFNDGTLSIPGGKITDAVRIEATAVEKTWGIKTDPTQLVFDTKHFGYPEIKAVRVTLENTGNQTLKLSVPTLTGQADKYDITFGSDLADGKLSLAPGKTETFTIRPKTGLLNGRYDGQVKITTDHDGTTASIPFLFTVQEAIVNNRVIHGVTGPVTGETPVTEIVETEQYTGTVTWSPAHSTFAPSTKYTATITLRPKPGYTLTGVPADYFAVDGADCTNAVDSGVITAVFPATAANARPSHRVTVEPGKNGDITVSRPAAPTGTTITVTVTPDAGYELADLSVTDKNGDELDVKSVGDNKFSFRMPAGGAFVSADFVPQREYGSFGDVARGDYFFDAAEWAAENGIMDGVGGGLFAPHSACTRAQIVTILYRMEGSPAASANPFRDVVSGSYYEKAVAWAAEHGIVAGYGSGLFGPNDRITREQLAAILYRYAQYKALDVSAGEDTNILSYNDAASIADYAYPALQWACGAGLLKGSNGDLLPKATATRAQTVTILYRMNALLK